MSLSLTTEKPGRLFTKGHVPAKAAGDKTIIQVSSEAMLCFTETLFEKEIDNVPAII